MNAQELSDATEELILFYNSTRIKPRKFNASVIGFELPIRGTTVIKLFRSYIVTKAGAQPNISYLHMKEPRCKWMEMSNLRKKQNYIVSFL